MHISLTKVLLLILGAILLIAGVFFGIDAMKAKDWVAGIFALVGIAVGFVLITGRSLTIGE